MFQCVRGPPYLSGRAYLEHLPLLTDEVVRQITLCLAEGQVRPADLFCQVVEGRRIPRPEGLLVDADAADPPSWEQADPDVRPFLRPGVAVPSMDLAVGTSDDGCAASDQCTGGPIGSDWVRIRDTALPGSNKVKRVLRKSDREQMAVVTALGLVEFIFDGHDTPSTLSEVKLSPVSELKSRGAGRLADGESFPYGVGEHRNDSRA